MNFFGRTRHSFAAAALLLTVPVTNRGNAVPTNVLVNNPAADAGTNDTQAGTAIVLGPSSNVLVMFNDSGSFASGTSNHFTGYARSTNGAASFTDLGKLPDSTFGDAGFPSLARNTVTGAIFAATLPFTQGNHIQVFKSVDSGVTFGLPVDATANLLTGSMDKPWITVDNFAGTGQGNVYVTWRNFGAANAVQMSRSVDGGLTFQPPVIVATATGGNVQGAVPVVSPDHSVNVFYLHETVPKQIKVAKSTNLGVSFGTPVAVATLSVTGVNGDLGIGPRTNAFPHPEVNPVSGHLYVVYPDKGTFPDRCNIHFTKSTDGGASWATPIELNSDSTTNDQWQPVLAVSPNGNNLFAGWYDRRKDPANSLIDTYGATAAITGATVSFRGNGRVSSQSFPLIIGQDNVVNPTFFGDYDTAAADNSFFYYPWGDTRGSSTRHLNQPDIRLAKIPVTGFGEVNVGLNAVSLLGGNDDGRLSPSECNNVFISLVNEGDRVLTNVSATLSSGHPQLTISQGFSRYPSFAGSATSMNSTAFRVSTSNLFPCGVNAQTTLTVTSAQGTFEVPVTLPGSTGAGSFTRFDNNTALPLADNGTVVSQIPVTGFAGVLAGTEVRLHATHTFVGDLRVSLVSPDGTTVSLMLNRGGSGDNMGSSCNPDGSRTTFLDGAATAISAGSAPFAGSFRPEQPLSILNGKTAAQVNGTWKLVVQDTASLDAGTLLCWSLSLAPAVCTPGGGACDPVFAQTGPFTGWSKSGVESGPESTVAPASADDVDVAATPTELTTIVRPATNRYRILGWTHPNTLQMPGADKHIRGRFFIYTSNPSTDPVNKVPAFRVRLQSEGAYVGSVAYTYGTTGNTGPDADGNAGTPNIYSILDNPAADTKAGQDLRPSKLANKPSLYRVDFDPVDVPAAVGSKVVATFESFSFVNPADGTLSLAEAHVSTYPAISDTEGTRIFTYRRSATAASQGVTFGFGGFNAENDFSPGYRQRLFVGSPFDSTPASQLHTGSEQAALNTTGVTIDTVNCPVNRFGVSILDVTASALVHEPRIAPARLYRARFYATSDIPTNSATSTGNRQGGVRFRMQTGMGTVNCHQDFTGAWSSTDNTISKQIGVQALPGVGSQNPQTDPTLTPAGHDGGWYTVLMPSPLDLDIRSDIDATIIGKMPQFSAEPGPGVNAASAKKITLGVDLIRQPTTLTLGPGAFSNLPFAQPNQAKVSITAIDLYELTARGD